MSAMCLLKVTGIKEPELPHYAMHCVEFRNKDRVPSQAEQTLEEITVFMPLRVNLRYTGSENHKYELFHFNFTNLNS